jgi:hypothetical protein
MLSIIVFCRYLGLSSKLFSGQDIGGVLYGRLSEAFFPVCMYCSPSAGVDFLLLLQLAKRTTDLFE